MNKKVICFDLDNVICKTKKNFYNKSIPKKNVIRFINQLYCDGFFIKIFTSRFMGRCKENVHRSKKKGFKFQEIMKLHLGEISNLKEKNEKLLKN